MNKEYIDFLNNFKDKIKNDKNWEKEEIHEYEKAIIEFIKDNQYKNNFTKYWIYCVVSSDLLRKNSNL